VYFEEEHCLPLNENTCLFNFGEKWYLHEGYHNNIYDDEPEEEGEENDEVFEYRCGLWLEWLYSSDDWIAESTSP
jgi:hypothetical protein